MKLKARKLDLDRGLFWPTLIILVVLCLPLVIWETSALDALNNIFEVIVDSFGWTYIWYPILLITFGFYFIFSKYGKVVLGDPTKKPRFTMFEYISMIVAMGIGSSIMRTGSIQWASVALDPPFGIEPLSKEALMWGNPYGMFLWSFHTFAIFAMTAPAMGYLLHVRKKPVMRISEICRCVFGDKFTDGIGGKILDVLFLLAIIAGSATFLGLGTPIVSAIVAKLLNIEITFGLTLIITAVWIVIFSVSVYLGLEKGIKNLSTINMYLAAGLGLLIIILGPTAFIINHFTESLGFLIQNYVNLSFYTDSLSVAGASHIQRFSVFWWAYCATWALLHGVFAAKISEGRTIRQMLLVYFISPLALSWIATGILGGVGIERYITGKVPVMEIMQNGGGNMVAIAEILSSIPLAKIILILFGLLTMTFFGTTMDSTTYTIAAYTDLNDMSKKEPKRSIRMLWAAIITLITVILLRVGGLVPLEVASGLMGFPIMFIQFITVYAAKKMMDEDKAWLRYVHNPVIDKPSSTKKESIETGTK